MIRNKKHLLYNLVDQIRNLLATRILQIWNQYALANCKIKINRLVYPYLFVNKGINFHIYSIFYQFVT